MTDNLGLNQTRVLDPTECSFESVTYQRKKPPLSCEVNLTGKLAAGHAQDVFSSMSASGWASIGTIKDSETNVKTGDIVCSPTYASSNIKLMAPTDLVAWVNGMKVVVNEKLIALGNTYSTSAQVVFLEVWRKLVGPTDSLYVNGDFEGATFPVDPAVDLIDPSIGIETSLRIQVQYRIRIAENAFDMYPDGFDPSLVFLQGPLSSPLSGSNYFTRVPGDPGLWRAGTGDAGAQALIGTVDGYTYAIPLCAVARRNTDAYAPAGSSNGAGRTLANYNAGLPSDRPDNKYSDYVVADDILDLRHNISSNGDVKTFCEKSFRKLIRGQLRTKMSRTTMGEDHYGVTMVQPDGIASDDPGWFNKIGEGNGQRRVFSKASGTQSKTLVNKTILQKAAGSSAGPWVSGDTITLLPTSEPVGASVVSVEDFYVTGLSSAASLTKLFIATGDMDSYVSDNFGTSWPTLAGQGFLSVLAGDKFIGADNSQNIKSSTDGVNWFTRHTNGIFNPYTILAWNTDVYVAIATNEAVYSTDGITWSLATGLGSNSLKAAVWGGGQFITVGDFGQLSSSSDGITWSGIGSIGYSDTLRSLVWDGTQFIAVGDSGVIYTSSNGVSWTLRTSTVVTNLTSIARNRTTMVAVGDAGTVVTSTNGILWVDQTLGAGLSAYNLTGISWTGTEFIAVGNDGAGNSIIASSSSGYGAWSTITTPTSINLYALTCGNMRWTSTTAQVITSNLQNYPITSNYTVSYPASSEGFTQLPTEILEFRPEAADSSSIASMDADIPVRTSDALSNATLSYRGGDPTALYDFGQQMVYHVPIATTGITQIQFNRNLFGYNIIGIASMYDGVTYRALTNVSRSLTQYTIITSPSLPVGTVTLNLFVEGKLFETNKQGRGITDSFEMKEFTPFEVANGSRTVFHVDSTNKAILKVASNSQASGIGIAYVNGTQKDLLTDNQYLPTDSTASRATIEFAPADAPVAAAVIEVPVLMKSALEYSEGYVCYYKILPYQGMLTAVTQGTLEAEGPVIVTTAGSGAITGAFNQMNVIDRLPALKASNDSSGYSESISLGSSYFATTDANPVLETMPRIRTQDILDQDSENVHIGSIGPADRGRKAVHIDGATLGLGNLGLKYDTLYSNALGHYQKTYQSYVVNKDSSGEMYLMVVGSESDSVSPSRYLDESSNNDVVDLFRLPGRPISTRKAE